MPYENARRTPLRQHEVGSVLIFNLFGIFLVMFLGTLAVDASNLYYTARTVRTGAEAGALAVAASFDQSIVGWMESRRAGFIALRANDIRGSDGSLKGGGLGSGLGPYDPKFKAETMDSDLQATIPTDGLEPSSPYNHVVFVVGNTVVTIERGFYGIGNSASGDYAFTSLEGAGRTTTIVPQINNTDCPCPVWQVANAARVTVQVMDQGMLFSSMLPNFPNSIPTITQSAVAARADYFLGP